MEGGILDKLVRAGIVSRYIASLCELGLRYRLHKADVAHTVVYPEAQHTAASLM